MEKIAIYLPVASAVMWGASYALYEKALQNLSVTTWVAVTGFANILTAYLLIVFGLPKVDYGEIMDSRIGFIVFVTLALSTLAYMSTLFAIKYISATYASIGEVAYVIFIPIFSYLIFGYKNFNNYTLIGGILVMAGIVIVIKGQYLVKS